MTWLNGTCLGHIIEGVPCTTIDDSYWCWDIDFIQSMSESCGDQLENTANYQVEDLVFMVLRDALPRVAVTESVELVLS